MRAFVPTIILDAGPIVAVCDRYDPEHIWASTQVFTRPGIFFVSSAAVAEATHLVKNYSPAIDRVRELIGRMQVEDPPPVEVLATMKRYAPEMDYADACAVLLARRYKGAVVLTTDHRDFSIYRVPFVSPKGEFCP